MKVAEAIGVFGLRIVAVYLSNVFLSISYGNWRRFPSVADASWVKIHIFALLSSIGEVIFYLAPAYAIAWILYNVASTKLRFSVDTIYALLCLAGFPLLLMTFFLGTCEDYSASWGDGQYIDHCRITSFGVKYYLLSFLQVGWQTFIYLFIAFSVPFTFQVVRRKLDARYS
jgi:hypothetical protein